MKKIIILQGPPCSGKTTWVNEFLASLDNEQRSKWVVANRDNIRFEICNGKYNMEHEQEVSERINQIMENASNNEQNIISDNTNLNPKYNQQLEEWANAHAYNIEYKLFYVPFKEAMQRSKKRKENGGLYINKGIMQNFYQKYFPEEYEKEMLKTVNYKRNEIDVTLPKAVLCDIDGTVAWMQGRSPYDITKVSEDKADFRLFQLIQILMDADVNIIFVSGREGTAQCRQDTICWLKKHLKNYHIKKLDSEYDKFQLFMRKEKDYRGDEIVKKEIYENEIKGKYDVICAFDDRNKVVNMWRNQVNILCCQVNEGDF